MYTKEFVSDTRSDAVKSYSNLLQKYSQVYAGPHRSSSALRFEALALLVLKEDLGAKLLDLPTAPAFEDEDLFSIHSETSWVLEIALSTASMCLPAPPFAKRLL